MAYLERRGFVEVDRWAQLFLELAAHDPVDPVPPPGVELAWLSDRPDLLEAMYRGWPSRRSGTRRESFHAWQVYELGDPRLRLELTALAVAEERGRRLPDLPRITGGANRLQSRADGPPPGDEQAVGEALARVHRSRPRNGGRLETLFAWAPPGRKQELFEALGYEARSASIDFHGPLQ